MRSTGIWTLCVLLFAIHAYGAEEEKNDPIPSTVETLRDPLHPGNAVNLNLSVLTGATQGNSNIQVQVTHSFTDSFTAGVTVPYLLHEKIPSVVGSKTPRIGGNNFNRIVVDGLARFLGDERSYLNLDLLIGLPFQSDPALQNSAYDSFMFGGILTGHYRFSLFAVEASFSDANGFPVHQVIKGGDHFLDSINYVTYSLQLFYYPTDRLDLKIGLTETEPLRTDVGTDIDYTFIISESSTSRRDALGFGFDYALDRDSTLLSGSVNYLTSGTTNTKGGIQITGGLKWIF